MKYIQKGNPPGSLRSYARQPNATYDGYPDKDAWSEVLLAEQGCLCAYTMMRIDKGHQKMKREHIVPQNGRAANDLDHWNVVAVCIGNEGKPSREQYADTRKRDRTLDPRLSPLNRDCERFVRYNPRGEVRIDDQELADQAVDSPANRFDSLLNLNHPDLIRGRNAAYEALKRIMDTETWKSRTLEEWLDIYTQRDKDQRFKEYCQFVIYRLQRRLKKAE